MSSPIELADQGVSVSHHDFEPPQELKSAAQSTLQNSRTPISDKPRKTFEFRRRLPGVLIRFAARGRIPPKRMAIWCTEPRAEKRMSLR